MSPDAEWNLANPRGTRVSVERDDGSVLETNTRSQAWVLANRTAVVLVDGIRGPYLLSRVTAKELGQ